MFKVPQPNIASGIGCALPPRFPGVEIRVFVSEQQSAVGLSTGTVSLPSFVRFPYHCFDSSRAITVLEGDAEISVLDRTYRLTPYDCIHVPGQIPHTLRSADPNRSLLVHWALAAANPDFVVTGPPDSSDVKTYQDPPFEAPEHIVRFESAPVYELSPGAMFRDLFASRFGTKGICGGYGRFRPGSSLPCHVHNYDESITIVEGDATCLVQGIRHQLANYDTAFVPQGRPHRFVNESNSPMAMIWVYAGDEPERTLVNSDFCSGKLVWDSASPNGRIAI